MQCDLTSSSSSGGAYAAVLKKIFSFPKGSGTDLKLSNIEKLCESFNHPERAFPTIHVAGTNGKGSVCTKIAASLQAAGYVTGLYTSPHITTFRERIQVGGRRIAEEELATLFCEVEETMIRLHLPAIFFEVVTLLAFLCFQRHLVDVAVIETGLGGRWDPTNVITPLVSVITSIGYDHTDLLGFSLEEIACEKAGIIKKGVPVVLGPDVPYSLMKEKADTLGCPLYRNTLLGVDFDLENQETARLACATLAPHFSLSEEAIRVGSQAKPPCRFECYQRQKPIVLDVAHNPHGLVRLLQMLKQEYPDHDYRFVVGLSRGKEISACARLIQEHAHAVHLVSGAHPRLISTAELHNAFVGHTAVHVEKTVSQGVHNALQMEPLKKEVLVVAGSFFMMSEVRRALNLPYTELG